jgi:trimeric autotransporter adhesin
MKAFRLALLALACPLTLFSQTATQRPAAPQVTVGADIKLLQFDWEPAARASYYQLMVKPGRSSQYQTAGDRIPASETRVDLPIPVHLQYWADTRYILRACNSAGCTNSAVINPRNLMLDTIGYLKASNTGNLDIFGADVALSADGYTLAVNAMFEDSNASGVNGNQADDSSQDSGAVYVFRRRGNAWHQEAYLKAGVNQPQQSFGAGYLVGHRVIAISADGNMLAVGAPRQIVNGLSEAGVVYVFRRIRNVWGLAGTLQSPTPQQTDFFGYQLGMSQDGRTLVVTGIRPFVNEEGDFGARTYVFVRPGSAWQHSVTLQPELPQDMCQSVRLSGDGNTLIAHCFSYARPPGQSDFVVTRKRSGNAWPIVNAFIVDFARSRQPIALDYDASHMALEEGRIPSQVGVYRWEAGAWIRYAGLAGPSIGPAGNLGFGYSLAFNNDATLLAVGAPFSEETGTGVSNTPAPGDGERGAAYLYRPGGAGQAPWVMRAVVTAPTLGLEDAFGVSVALSGSGRTLAVGASAEDGGATGLDGDREDNSVLESGAVFLY